MKDIFDRIERRMKLNLVLSIAGVLIGYAVLGYAILWICRQHGMPPWQAWSLAIGIPVLRELSCWIKKLTGGR